MQKKRVAIFLLFFFTFFQIFLNLKVNAVEPIIRYQVHCQTYGWFDWISSPEIAGTTGQAKRMESIKIKMAGIDGNLTYQVHCQTYGWLNPASEGTLAGTTGQAKRMEAIIIKLEDSSYNIKYRVHVQTYGWMDWVNSGEIAGTTGKSKRIEAIQIKIEKKNNIETNEQIIQNNSNVNTEENSVINNEIINEDIGNNITNENLNNDNNLTNKFFGIDVSRYQGTIDWNRVKESGVHFAMIRCGYRGYTEGKINEDTQFLNNIVGAYNNGVKVGIYFYSSAINEAEAIEEANYVINLINKYGVKNYISYPIAVDIEDFEGTRNYSLTVRERTNVVKTFCEIIKKEGFNPMVYSYTYFLENKLFMDELINYDTWIADYYGNTWYKRKYSIWQYTDKGYIEGILGNVDLNYSYKNY